MSFTHPENCMCHHCLPGSDGISYEEQQRQDRLRNPYEVWHPEGQGTPPTFPSWADAQAAAKNFNRDVSGHVARRRQLMSITANQLWDALSGRRLYDRAQGVPHRHAPPA
jgi:hypothetical protein